jgi:polyadenylate-binding protein
LLISLPLTLNSIEDDTALRAKVDEALNVYDEYVKNKGGEGEAEGGEAAKEAKEDEKTEEKA